MKLDMALSKLELKKKPAMKLKFLNNVADNQNYLCHLPTKISSYKQCSNIVEKVRKAVHTALRPHKKQLLMSREKCQASKLLAMRW